MKTAHDIIVRPIITEKYKDLMAAKTTQFNTLNVYDILNAEKLVMTVDAVKKLEEVYA